MPLQAAEQIAQAAQAHAEDDNFESPYSRAALRQGLDLPWWQKLVTATFKNGRFELGRLKVGHAQRSVVPDDLCIQP